MTILPASKCSYPLREGNLVVPLVDGGPAFRRIAEAACAAEAAVWVTVAFHHWNFEIPGGHGSLFRFLDRLAREGRDVRALFWRHHEHDKEGNHHFHGLDGQRQFLEQNKFAFKARWDCLPNKLCHHQKSWVVDPYAKRPITFVGGINLEDESVRDPGHDHEHDGGIHDVYVEVQGPSATDVVHNFVQRWNGASERQESHGNWPSLEAADDLDHRDTLAETVGPVPVQISRTVRKQQDYAPIAAVGAEPFPIHGAEKSTLETYLNAIQGARSSIYIEDQALASNQALGALIEGAERGVEIVALVPVPANDGFVVGREMAPDAEIFGQLDQLSTYDNFTLVGISRSLSDGSYDDIYVHAKIMLVDDAWTTIGSTNFADRSFHGDTELNASFWCADATRKLRVDLLAEHMGLDTSGISDVEALLEYKRVSKQNRARREKGARLSCLAFELDPTSYGLDALTGRAAPKFQDFSAVS